METIISYSNTTHAVDRPSFNGRFHSWCGMNLTGDLVERDERSVDCPWCRAAIDHGDAIREYISTSKREASEMLNPADSIKHLNKALLIPSVCKALGITQQQLRYAVPGCHDLNWNTGVNAKGITRLEKAVVNRA